MTQYTLRTYQQDAVASAINWIKKNSEPALLELSGGAGKSLICAEIARIVYQMTGKRVLILVPNQDLLIQNGEKLELTGEKFSFYSASVSKSLRHHIVLATEGTFKSIAEERGHEFTLVIVDEAHKVTPTFIQIIEDMRKGNPLLRVIGMTGTPFRASTGYIYELDLDNKLVQETTDPYYKKLLYRITCDELIAMGFLTPVRIGLPSASYDTKDMKLTTGDDFTESQLKKAFEHKSITEQIVADFVEKTKNDKYGVIIFCATLKHAQEVYDLLPSGSAVFLHGKLSNADRKKYINAYKSGKVKYLVNKDIASTGFDAPHTGWCVFMRAIGSNGLFQQMLWRMVRLFEGKEYSTLLDYGNNIENLFDGSSDIFTPKIKAYGSKPSIKIEVMCEDCGTEQEHSKRPNYESWDAFGYATDLSGDRLDPPIPAHYGRRCTGVSVLGKNQFSRCNYYWTCSTCKECGHKNDIAARSCESCGLTLIDPESKLSEQAIYIPVGETSIARVDNMTIKGSDIVYVTFDTPHGQIKCRFFQNHAQPHVARHGWAFSKATNNGQKKPSKIEYTVQKSGYCSINRYIFEG